MKVPCFDFVQGFTAAYLLSLAAAVLLGVFVFSTALPWPGLAATWVLILLGLGFYRRTHTLTDSLSLQQYHLTLVIMLAVQVMVGGIATLLYFVGGRFYTLFLNFEVVAFAFLMVDWLEDKIQVQRLGPGRSPARTANHVSVQSQDKISDLLTVPRGAVCLAMGIAPVVLGRVL